jgi:hypothetical protein
MHESILATNRRAVLLALVPTCLMLAAGAGLGMTAGESTVVLILGLALAAVGGVASLSLLVLLFSPRLALEGQELLVYLRAGRPFRVPVDVIECFFIGQAAVGPGVLVAGQPKSVSVVVRLAERAGTWATRPVLPMLGHWDDGYIVIRGTWCEPIDLSLVNRMNEKLIRRRQEASTV